MDFQTPKIHGNRSRDSNVVSYYDISDRKVLTHHHMWMMLSLGDPRSGELLQAIRCMEQKIINAWLNC